MKKWHVKKCLNFIWKHKMRTVMSLLLISLLFLTPQMTAAQFKGVLNGVATLNAGVLYFSSNYLKEIVENDSTKKGASNIVDGWNGTDDPFKDVEISIRNYDNTLLANPEGTDLTYHFTWSIKTCDPSGNTIPNGYNLSVINKSHVSGNTPTISDNSATNTIPGTGVGAKDVYEIHLTSPANLESLAAGSYVEIVLQAENVNQENNFLKKLQAYYKYTIMSDTDFVTTKISEESGTDDMTFQLGTNFSADLTGSSRTVKIWWDRDLLDIRADDYTFLKLEAEGKYKQVTTDNGKNYGVLTLENMGSSEVRSFQFKKQGAGYERWFPAENPRYSVGKNQMYTELTEDQIENCIIGYKYEVTNHEK